MYAERHMIGKPYNLKGNQRKYSQNQLRSGRGEH